MKLTILGVNGPCPTEESGCSGYLVETDGGTRILIDCGSGVLPRLKKYAQPKDLSAMILSHLHFDHISDALVMQYSLQLFPSERNLPVYAPEKPEAVRKMLESPYYDLYSHEDCMIGDARVSFVPSVHPFPGSSVAIFADGKKFVFTGDTNENPELELFADGADLLLADAALPEAKWKPASPHLSARRAGQLAMNAGAKQLVLTHFFPQYPAEDLLQEAKSVYPEAEVGEVGAVRYI